MCVWACVRACVRECVRVRVCVCANIFMGSSPFRFTKGRANTVYVSK